MLSNILRLYEEYKWNKYWAQFDKYINKKYKKIDNELNKVFNIKKKRRYINPLEAIVDIFRGIEKEARERYDGTVKLNPVDIPIRPFCYGKIHACKQNETVKCKYRCDCFIYNRQYRIYNNCPISDNEDYIYIPVNNISTYVMLNIYRVKITK